jgi:hypothetical protein
MQLRDLLEIGASSREHTFYESDPHFAEVVELMNGPASGLFESTIRHVSPRPDGSDARLTAITIANGLTGIGQLQLQQLRQ